MALGSMFGQASAMDLGLNPQDDADRELLLKRKRAMQQKDPNAKVAPYMGAFASLFNGNGNQF